MYKESNENKINKLIEENNLLKKKIEVLEKTQNMIIETKNFALFKYKKKIITEQNLETMSNLNEKINETDINKKEMELEMKKYLPFYKERIEEFKKKRKNTDNDSKSIEKKQKINDLETEINDLESEINKLEASTEQLSSFNKKLEVSSKEYSSVYKLTIDSYIRKNWSKIKLNNVIKYRMKDIKDTEGVNNLIIKLGEKVDQIMKNLWIQNESKFKEIFYSKKNLGKYIQHLLEPKARLIVKSMNELIKKFNEYNKNSGSFVTYETSKHMELLLSSKSIPIVKNKGICGEDGIFGLRPPKSLIGKKEYQNGVWYFPKSCFKLITII